MLFRRKTPAGFAERARTALWPRRSFGRSFQYFAKRIVRISATPHAVAAGVAAGAFASFLPFPGFHFILAALLAWLIAGNLIASALGTAVGNPLTFPLIWGSTYEVGRLMLHGRQPDAPRSFDLVVAFRHMEWGQLWDTLLRPMTVGGVPLGLFFALVLYALTRTATATFQARRREKLARRAQQRIDGANLPGAALP